MSPGTNHELPGRLTYPSHKRDCIAFVLFAASADSFECNERHWADDIMCGTLVFPMVPSIMAPRVELFVLTPKQVSAPLLSPPA